MKFMAMSPILHNSDIAWMQRALSLARAVRGHVSPNPPVGCVIVKDGAVVAEAATHPGGRPHAERKALDQAGGLAKESTLFVTLEPCCHWGRTPPCADAIIKAEVSRVVCAVQDPDPRVNGGGFAKLRKAGIDLSVGTCRHEAEAVLSGFFHRVRYGLPEFVETEPALGELPDGVDAVLVSVDDGLALATRSGCNDGVKQSPNQMLRWIGELGLTTVAIPRDDPLWAKGFASKREDISGKASVRSAHGAEM